MTTGPEASRPTELCCPSTYSLAAASSGRLFRILNDLSSVIEERELAILELRLSKTLKAIGETLHITRERVRQLEDRSLKRVGDYMRESQSDICNKWDRILWHAAAVSEVELFEPYVVPGSVDLQYIIGRICLSCVIPSIAQPMAFDKKVVGWWTRNPSSLTETLRRIVQRLPLRPDDLPRVAVSEGLADALPIQLLIAFPGSSAIYNDTVEGWVRARAKHRDAAWLALSHDGRPVPQHELAALVGLTPKVLAANLSRDRRFVLLQPQGEWSLADWTHLEGAQYRNTLEAVTAVLRESGPLSLRALTNKVIARYPVSPSAVFQCLASRDIGRWPDGRVGLAENGAPAVLAQRLSQPSNVQVRSNGEIVFTRTVDADLLRGSSTPLPRFIGQQLGLSRAPMSMKFSGPLGLSATVTWRITGVTLSTLRSDLLRLGATIGCRLEIEFNPSHASLALRLVCDHEHPRPKELTINARND